MSLGIRAKVAMAAAIATVSLLSLVAAFGYRSMVAATRESQIDLLDSRLDDLEERLASGDDRVVGSLQIDSGLRVVRAGSALPPQIPATLRIVREHPDPDIRALVGVVDTRRIDGTFDTIRISLWIAVVVTALVVGATSWVVVDRALSPVRRLTRQAETNMASRSLDPVTADGTNDDIDNLANTFNAMLDRLRNADAERRRFVSDASHELRTPLMVLSADAEYVLDHPDASAKPEAEELATAVLDQSTRLTELVDGLLTLATLDEEQPMTAGPISVATLLTSADANSLLAGPPPATEVLVPDVSRSLINVLANALRHHQNQIELEVSVDQERQAVSFIVDDDGPGVPEAERENIFQRFYRPDHGRTRSEGGAGLGLAIARAEIAQAGGTVAVSDSPMGGARFVITVPISSEDRTAR